MAEENNQEFAAITNLARDIDKDAQAATGTPGPGGVLATQVIDPAAAWAEIPAAVGQVLCMAMPELKEAYNPKACLEWGKAMARLAAKRGWSQEGLPPEVSVGLASLGFVVPTAICVKLRRDAAARAAKAKASESQPSTGAESVGQAV